MPQRDPTEIGRVRHVLGSTVTVSLNEDLAGVAPIYRGKLIAIGQIGSLVRIPQGIVDLVATVSMVGIAELSGAPVPSGVTQNNERWLQVQLLGEIDKSTGQFDRGVGSFPGLDDPVHFATPEQLASVYPKSDENHLKIGTLSAAESVPVCLNAAKLVVRHGAVVGSTGAGKTSTVASILQSFIRGGWRAANIVVVDPHGEYAEALQGCASVRSVLSETARLRVPFWALSAAEILKIFTGSAAGATVLTRFSTLVVEERRRFAATASWLTIEPAAITPDTPIPFDLRTVWYRLDRENRATRSTKGDPNTETLRAEGDAASLRSAEFEPYGPGGQPPHRAPEYGLYGSTPDMLRLGLLDPRLSFFQEPSGENCNEDPLVDVVQEWLGEVEPISVLDFSGVPALAADLAVGVVMNLLFEIAIRCQRDGPGIGRPSPLLIVLEEAHRYLGESSNPQSRDAANRIAREGRKYGVGLLLVTQRPTELPETALAQCGTLISLRLTNGADQGRIKAALPDAIAGLGDVLPSLRTGEAIVTGEAVVLPSRTKLTRPDPEPKAGDPDLKAWRATPELPQVAPALREWRGTYESD